MISGGGGAVAGSDHSRIRGRGAACEILQRRRTGERHELVEGEEMAATSPHSECQNSNNPSSAEIRAELETVLLSESFLRSPRLVSFLRFIVEADLRGQRACIKGITIAVEALGRGVDFDPEKDPIVRVEAGRLRRALRRYYDGPGEADLIVIDVPRGRYVPTFRYRDVEQANGPCLGNRLFSAPSKRGASHSVRFRALSSPWRVLPCSFQSWRLSWLLAGRTTPPSHNPRSDKHGPIGKTCVEIAPQPNVSQGLALPTLSAESPSNRRRGFIEPTVQAYAAQLATFNFDG
jgi:hypothetical protein